MQLLPLLSSLLQRQRPSHHLFFPFLFLLLLFGCCVHPSESKLTDYPGDRRVFGAGARRVVPLVPRHTSSTVTTSSRSAGAAAASRKPLKIALVVEPTPFTHVSGYANRYC
jgi:hypothetical protein